MVINNKYFPCLCSFCTRYTHVYSALLLLKAISVSGFETYREKGGQLFCNSLLLELQCYMQKGWLFFVSFFFFGWFTSSLFLKHQYIRISIKDTG